MSAPGTVLTGARVLTYFPWTSEPDKFVKVMVNTVLAQTQAGQ